MATPPSSAPANLYSFQDGSLANWTIDLGEHTVNSLETIIMGYTSQLEFTHFR